MYSVGNDTYAKIVDSESAVGYTMYKNHKKFNCFSDAEIAKIIGKRCNNYTYTIVLTTDNRLWWKESGSWSKKVTEIKSVMGKIVDICLDSFVLNILYDDGTVMRYDEYVNTDLIPKLKEFPNNIVVTDIASGANHTVVLTDTGNVYSWGANDYGQLGYGHCKRKTIPGLISADVFNQTPVTSIACGDNHSIFLTRSNTVYATGSNQFGQLVLHDKLMYNLPQKMSYDFELIRSIYACADHTIILASSNNIYTAGSNRDAQLGIGNDNAIHRPICCNFFSTIGATISEIICNDSRTFVITTDGDSYIAGRVFLPGVPYTNSLWHKIRMPNDSKLAVNKSGA